MAAIEEERRVRIKDEQEVAQTEAEERKADLRCRSDGRSLRPRSHARRRVQALMKRTVPIRVPTRRSRTPIAKIILVPMTKKIHMPITKRARVPMLKRARLPSIKTLQVATKVECLIQRTNQDVESGEGRDLPNVPQLYKGAYSSIIIIVKANTAIPTSHCRSSYFQKFEFFGPNIEHSRRIFDPS